MFKIVNRKIIGGIRKIRDSRKKPEQHVCAISDRQRCLSRKENLFLDSDTPNQVTSKSTDVSEELNATGIPFTCDAFTQTRIATCSCNKDKQKLRNRHFNGRIAVMNSVSTSLSDNSPMNNARDEMKGKIKKYKKCSCGEQCPYAMYKLPCSTGYKQGGTSEARADDETGGLALECASFREKNNFPSFISIDTTRKSKKYFLANSLPVEINEDSSLSVDPEVRNDARCDPKHVSEFSKRRRARTYILSGNEEERRFNLNQRTTKNRFYNAILSQANRQLTGEKD